MGEMGIIRREIAGSDSAQGKQTVDNETLSKFEIMDGAPVREQCVPVRLYLSSCNLTPTFKNVQNKFSVKYFLNLVIVDEEDRRYFKQSEIFFTGRRLGDVVELCANIRRG